MAATTSIRILQESDFGSVWDVFQTTFPAKYGEEFTDAWMARNRNLSYGTFGADGCLHGFLVTTHSESHAQKIEFLGVNPSCQKGGIGTELLKKILDYCLRTGFRATLIPVNDPRIIHWYKKHGFVNYGLPFVSSYTGDIEQHMIFIPNKSASEGRSLGSENEDAPRHQEPLFQPPDTRMEPGSRATLESLPLLTA